MCLLLAVLSAVGMSAFLLVRATTAVVAAVPGEIQATRAALVSEIQATRGDLTVQVQSAREDLLRRAERQVAGLRGDVMAEVSKIRVAADRRVGDTLGRVDTALEAVNALHNDLKPTLNNTAAITEQTKDASAILFRRDALPAQLLGLTAAAKVTLGQTAETMRDIQRATPEIVANVKATTEASTEASRNTAQVMANFAKATKPLPAWARVVLAVAPPAVQTGATIVTTLALTGK
jgi:ABC-type transporter Mla subunit MlaD